MGMSGISILRSLGNPYGLGFISFDFKNHYYAKSCILSLLNNYTIDVVSLAFLAQLAGAEEYTDCFSAEG